MFFTGDMLTRSGHWPTRLAIRCIFTCAFAIVAAVAIHKLALPTLTEESAAMGAPAATGWIVHIKGLLPLTPIPGLLLAIGAIALRSSRAPLAILATLATVAAILLIIGTLVGSLLPMYQIP